jgi:hypothetical protein
MNVVTKDNYGPNLAGLWAQAFLIEEAPLAEMLAAAEHADTVGAIVDPTLYREKMRALHEDMEMLRALLHVQTTLESIRRRRAGAAVRLRLHTCGSRHDGPCGPGCE